MLQIKRDLKVTYQLNAICGPCLDPDLNKQNVTKQNL